MNILNEYLKKQWGGLPPLTPPEGHRDTRCCRPIVADSIARVCQTAHGRSRVVVLVLVWDVRPACSGLLCMSPAPNAVFSHTTVPRLAPSAMFYILL